MGIFEWAAMLVWPIAVVYVYSVIVDGTLKARAEVLSEHYNKMGSALQTIAKEVVEIKSKLGI